MKALIPPRVGRQWNALELFVDVDVDVGGGAALAVVTITDDPGPPAGTLVADGDSVLVALRDLERHLE